MGFIMDIFGGGQEPEAVAEPLAEPEEQTTSIDPNRDQELSEAAKKKHEILARRGRSKLVTSRAGNDSTRSGVSVAT